MNKYFFISMLISVSCFYSSFTLAENININNNNNNDDPSGSTAYACPPANQNNIYDKRVPPAGVYKQYNSDGSSSTNYTTGETKPYITNNNCNNNSNIPVVPYVIEKQ